MLSGFKDFVARGNVIDLAVGVIIGAAFGEIVNSLVKDVITPAMGAVAGSPDFSAIRVGVVQIGSFMNAVLAFVLKAAGLYFFIVLPFMKLRPPAPAPGPTPTESLLMEIRDALKGRTASVR